MMLSEFIERTGFHPLAFEYEKIEEAYYNFDGDKDAFCLAFVSADGEKKVYQARATEIERLNGKILEAQKSLVPGDHGTTYGGNPFAGAAVRTVLEIMERDKITEHVQEIGGYLWERLEGLRRKHECIVDHRGIGLMQGLSVSVPVGEVSRKALEKGLVLITAGADMIRFVPPLVIEEEHVDLMVQILDGILP